MSLLHEVAACGEIEKLDDLLAQTRIDKNEKDEDWGGRTPLQWATIEGHLSCVKKLLQAGANPTLRNNDEKTVAHFAAECGRCDILKAVLEYGCDVTIKDKYGDTAMDYALLYGNLECADLINKFLSGEFNLRVDSNQWASNTPSPKILRPDVRRRQTLLSLLSGMKGIQTSEDVEPTDGKTTPSRRRRKKSGKKPSQKSKK